MALVNLPSPLTDGTIAYGSEVKANDDAIVNDYNGNIQNVNCASNMGLVDTKLAQITTASKVAGTALTGLASIPGAAGVIPAANLPAITVQCRDTILRGFELVYSSTTAVIVNPGTMLHGSTLINTTATTTLTLATAANWYDGATHTYGSGAGWCYIGVNSLGDIKLLGANPPNKADTSGNTAGVFIYSYITTTYWRVIGVAWVTTGDVFLSGFLNDKDWFYNNDGGTAVTGVVTNSYSDFTCVVPYGTTIAKLTWSANGANDTLFSFRVKGKTNAYFSLMSPDSSYGMRSVVDMPLNSSGIFEYKNDNGSLYKYGTMTTIGYKINWR